MTAIKHPSRILKSIAELIRTLEEKSFSAVAGGYCKVFTEKFIFLGSLIMICSARVLL
jgi:hypothetical protein